MKLPAAVAFAAGILLGVQGFDSGHAGSHRFPEVLLVGIGLGLSVSILSGFFALPGACGAALVPLPGQPGVRGCLPRTTPLPARHILLRLKADQLCRRRESLWPSEPRITSAAYRPGGRGASANRRSQSERELLCGLPGIRNPIRPRAGAR